MDYLQNQYAIVYMSSGRQEQTSPRGSQRFSATTKTNPANSSSSKQHNKPRPLQLVNSEFYRNGDPANPYHYEPNMTTGDLNELIPLMHQINQNVKLGQFNATLASQIFRLCNELKNYGEVLEQTNRDDLNRVFVSLRQACCRDSGQLGTPCRLKIMELIELRAMGWRPNYSHSQYYFQHHHGGDGSDMMPADLGPAPVSAPPFGAIPVNPFSPYPMGMPSGNAPAASAAQLVSANPDMPQPQYYLIPANTVSQHTQAGIAFVTPANAATLIQPPMAQVPPPPMTAPIVSGQQYSFGGAQSANGNGVFPKGAVIKGKYSKPFKVPGKNQFRDEVVIRNADSGKIMGIKGRRVAIVEELSKTVISFQKVPQGAKERTLTITGPTEESIVYAKELVDDTIRRNASPARASGGEAAAGEEESEKQGGDQFDLDSDIINLTCNDPKLLQVAKVALREYFERHQPLRRSLTDNAGSVGNRDERKERRKSMPPMSEQPEQLLAQMEAVGESPGSSATSVLSDTVLTPPDSGPSPQYKKCISTPNLAQPDDDGTPSKPLLVNTKSDPDSRSPKSANSVGSGKMLDFGNGDHWATKASEYSSADKSGSGATMIQESKSRLMMRVVYTREFLLQCARSPLAQVPPPGMGHIASDVSDILRPLPGKFDPTDYKNQTLLLRQPSYPFA